MLGSPDGRSPDRHGHPPGLRASSGDAPPPDRPRRPAPVSSPNRASVRAGRSEEHTSELQSLMLISYAVFCLKKKHSADDITYDICIDLPRVHNSNTLTFTPYIYTDHFT